MRPLLPQPTQQGVGVGLGKNQMNKDPLNSIGRPHREVLERFLESQPPTTGPSRGHRWLQEQQTFKAANDIQDFLSCAQGWATADISSAWGLHSEFVQENSAQLLQPGPAQVPPGHSHGWDLRHCLLRSVGELGQESSVRWGTLAFQSRLCLLGWLLVSQVVSLSYNVSSLQRALPAQGSVTTLFSSSYWDTEAPEAIPGWLTADLSILPIAPTHPSLL